MNSPNFQTNDPVATRQLLEISQYSHDVRYKPGKSNLTADALSRPEVLRRPKEVPPGDAYCPEPDVIAAAKFIVTNQLQRSSKSHNYCGLLPLIKLDIGLGIKTLNP